jgi:AcrR family transcriptional regulator
MEPAPEPSGPVDVPVDPPADVPTRLVEATIRLLAEQGPSAIKTRTVATASGLSTMVVYSHFGGVPELLGAVIDEGFRRLAAAFERVPVTDDPVADLCSMALETRRSARANPHLYDLMFGLSMRATYRPAKEPCTSPGGRSTSFQCVYGLVTDACARLVGSGRVGDHDPAVLAGQLWSMVHGFVTLELSDHFTRFEDPAASILLPLGTQLVIGLGDDPARARASHERAGRAHS